MGILRRVLRNIKRYYKVSKSFLKNLFINIYEAKVSILVILLVIAIFIAAFKLEIHFKKVNGFLDRDFWLESLLPNIIADMIGIIFTSFIIAGLFARHQKKSEERKLHNIIGYDFRKLINVLSRNFLYLLKRDEEFLSFSISDQKVINEIKDLTFERQDIFDFSTFNSTFRVWDVNSGSSIIDSFVNSIEKIKEHDKIAWSHIDDLDELLLKKKKIKFELDRLDKNSERYKLRFQEYTQVSEEFRYRAYVMIPIDENLLNVEIDDVLKGCKKFFNEKTQGFCEKYTFILPIEVRLSLLELEKELAKIDNALYFYNNRSLRESILSNYNSIDEFREEKKQELFDSIDNLANELLRLSSYFKNIK
ncbi:hypothetical protein P2R64_32395 [Priestia megaterium]|uniref:hypothetical protein n=1 Tax=Priestia megaterium TaxID=1404 RepID=UPI0023DBE8AE|nr:hypothetical protein [Priestia megaterium]MDF1964704.1 hypothetical protein [Priestia megaterium]